MVHQVQIQPPLPPQRFLDYFFSPVLEFLESNGLCLTPLMCFQTFSNCSPGFMGQTYSSSLVSKSLRAGAHLCPKVLFTVRGPQYVLSQNFLNGQPTLGGLEPVRNGK